MLLCGLTDKDLFVEYVGANMGIQVPLLVIDRRRVLGRNNNTCGVSLFFEHQFCHKRSYTRAYTHPYERTHAHTILMSTSERLSHHIILRFTKSPTYGVSNYETTSNPHVRLTKTTADVSCNNWTSTSYFL